MLPSFLVDRSRILLYTDFAAKTEERAFLKGFSAASSVYKKVLRNSLLEPV